LSCNIRSINANIYELLLLLESKKNIFKPDIIVSTENWHDTNSCNILLPDYDMFFLKKKRNQNDSVIILYKNNLNIDYFEFDVIEANIVKITLSIVNNIIVFLCIYISPAMDSYDFLTTFKNILLN